MSSPVIVIVIVIVIEHRARLNDHALPEAASVDPQFMNHAEIIGRTTHCVCHCDKRVVVQASSLPRATRQSRLVLRPVADEEILRYAQNDTEAR